MKMPWSELEGPAKLLAICAAIFLVCSGLCGMEWFIAGMAGGKAQALLPAMVILGIIQAIAIVVSGIVGFIALILWAVRVGKSKG